jgi:Subtilase family
MKKTLLALLALACIAAASQPSYKPVRIDEPGRTKPTNRYRPDQMIVMFKSEPTSAHVNAMKARLRSEGIDPAKIEIKKCNSCKAYVELWDAPNIHSSVHAEGLVGGTVGPRGSKGVGEDGVAYYSLNFTQNIPMDTLEKKFEDYDYSNFTKAKNDTQGKDVVRIAVLDTGIDTKKIISTSYQWTNQKEAATGAQKQKDDDGNCYKDDTFGWNFIRNNNKVMDDNPDLHGTLVSHYIINEFAASSEKAVEIMTLKTHDKNGNGDLFASICAIYYAMENKAQIINASWGFYYYEERPHPYLDSLITQVLRKEGILFVAAAGNKIDKIDQEANDAYHAAHGVNLPATQLRNLQYHNFYPACLSRDDNNVITVTTADKNRVSPTQNYSTMYVDLGTIPDDHTSMRFRLPFPGPVATISGSSFAAAIATGRIGAFLPKSDYAPSISKNVVLGPMETQGLSTTSSSLATHHIRGGRITKHN